MDGIGPRLPLQRDETFGSYDLITSYFDEVKQNFKNLILTCPGEKMMNPNFGVGLRNFLFEPRREAIVKIRQRIDEQTVRYMPFVQIVKIEFNRGINPVFQDDTNVLSIMIQYEVPSLNLNSSLILQAEGTN
jgi:phage baseplate assembly protein W|tara:strand:- start:269 stop:664 length:396 start_codon:yes stop_codon:yes gene_type:complete